MSSYDQHPSKQKNEQAFRFTLYVFMAGVCLVTLLVVSVTYIHGFETWLTWRKAAEPFFPWWRLLLMVIFFGFWKRWVYRYAAWALLDQAQTRLLLYSKWRFLKWMLVVECVVNQNLLGSLLVTWLGV